MAKNIYTADEVARHNNMNDLWVVMNDKVYNLTSFVKEHPGGEEVLLDVAGQDGTNCFDTIGHSAEAILHREMYMIGELVEGETMNQNQQSKKAEEKEATIDDDDWQYQEPEEKKSFMVPLFIGIAIVAYAVIINYLW